MSLVSLSTRQRAEDITVSLVTTHVQSSVRHLEAIYRDLEMEHITTLGSVRWLDSLAPKGKFAELLGFNFSKVGTRYYPEAVSWTQSHHSGKKRKRGGVL